MQPRRDEDTKDNTKKRKVFFMFLRALRVFVVPVAT